MPSVYLVSAQIWCESAEEAVKRIIVPGSVKHVEVQDLAHQVQFPPVIPVPGIDEDVLPLD